MVQRVGALCREGAGGFGLAVVQQLERDLAAGAAVCGVETRHDLACDRLGPPLRGLRTGAIDGDEPLPAGLRAGRMIELEQVDQQAADLADGGVATLAAHVLDLLRQVLEVERAITALGGELAERFGLVPCPGVEVAVVEVAERRTHTGLSMRPWRLAGSQPRSRSWSRG